MERTDPTTRRAQRRVRLVSNDEATTASPNLEAVAAVTAPPSLEDLEQQLREVEARVFAGQLAHAMPANERHHQQPTSGALAGDPAKGSQMLRINTRRNTLQRHTMGDAVFLFARLGISQIRRSYATQYDRDLTGAETDEILRDALRGWEGIVDETGAPVTYADSIKVRMPSEKDPKALVDVEMSGVELFIATADPADKALLAAAIRAASWRTVLQLEQEKNGSAGSSNGDGGPARSGEMDEAPAA